MFRTTNEIHPHDSTPSKVTIEGSENVFYLKLLGSYGPFNLTAKRHEALLLKQALETYLDQFPAK